MLYIVYLSSMNSFIFNGFIFFLANNSKSTRQPAGKNVIDEKRLEIVFYV